jgi:hypothetical protein
MAIAAAIIAIPPQSSMYFMKSIRFSYPGLRFCLPVRDLAYSDRCSDPRPYGWSRSRFFPRRKKNAEDLAKDELLNHNREGDRKKKSANNRQKCDYELHICSPLNVRR